METGRCRIVFSTRRKGAAKLSPKAETACEECAASDPAALPEDSDSAEQ